jgi:hypothetical protein
MRKSVIIAIIAAAAVLAPAVVYAASPLFISNTIDEPLPVAKTGGAAGAQDGEPTIEGEMMEKSGDAMAKDDEPTMMEKEDAMIKDEVMAEKDAMTMAKEVGGTFAGAGDGIHNAEGSARVLNLEDGSAVLRLEDFKVTNGPDLYVYLSADRGASDFVDLGRLKANAGNQNYEIPSGTDLSKYDNVVIWCKSFSVYFGGAQLTAA